MDELELWRSETAQRIEPILDGIKDVEFRLQDFFDRPEERETIRNNLQNQKKELESLLKMLRGQSPGPDTGFGLQRRK